MRNVTAQEVRLDFSQGIEGWEVGSGRWTVETEAGKALLYQRAPENAFNAIVAPAGPFGDVDVSVQFKPIAGKEDASGGIVFRYDRGRYYVIRANALEDNFRLYVYDRSRRQIAGAQIPAPALGQWHTIRVVAAGDRIQGYLNGQLLIDHRDAHLAAGRVGLWTKADSVTAFSDLSVRGVPAP
jgi:hypothetical protein